MRKAFLIAFICLGALPLLSQTHPADSKSPDNWTVGTILAVKPHPGAKSVDASSASYDISVKVGDTIYVVLYTAPPGQTGVQYRAGLDLPVSVGTKVMTFNDVMGRQKQVPILSQKKVSARPHAPAANKEPST